VKRREFIALIGGAAVVRIGPIWSVSFETCAHKARV
jgi:hypothetical protein